MMDNKWTYPLNQNDVISEVKNHERAPFINFIAETPAGTHNRNDPRVFILTFFHDNS